MDPVEGQQHSEAPQGLQGVDPVEDQQHSETPQGLQVPLSGAERTRKIVVRYIYIYIIYIYIYLFDKFFTRKTCVVLLILLVALTSCRLHLLVWIPAGFLSES